MSLSPQGLYRFDEFELDRTKRTLLREGSPVSLAPKAFDVLAQLVANPGKLVTKEELIAAVWPESFVEEGNLAHHISSLRRAFADRSGYIVTIPGRGYQFTAEVLRQGPAVAEQTVPDQPPAANVSIAGIQTVRERTHVVLEETVSPAYRLLSQRLVWGVTAATVLLAGSAGAFFWASRPKPTARKLLVADFQNTTGDPNFDHILNQALQIDLEQSPYFTFVSQTKTRDTLTQMQRDKGEPLIGDLAREVCERNNGDAMLGGSIARLGHKFLITMDATDCINGNQLMEGKKAADSGDDVLGALDAIAADARRRLGESRSSVKQYSVPLFEENTGSLEALKAYSKASQLALQGKYMEAVPLFQRAIELDPKFAEAYFDLANSYNNLGDQELQIANLKRAYELRESADEPDRLYIIAAFHSVVTGDLYESLRNYQTWRDIYPQQSGPWGQIAGIYIKLGQAELAIEPARHALSLNEKNPAAYAILAEALMHAGQFEAAKAICQQAVQKKLDGSDLHDLLTQIAYAVHDTAGVDAEIEWAKESSEGSRVKQDMVLIAFAQGQGRKAQELMRQSTESYRRDGMAGLANLRLLVSTRPLSEEGLKLQARKLLDSVPLADLTNPMVAMAETGEIAQADSLLKQAMERHPLDTLWQKYRGPQIYAAILLADGKPQEAIEALRPGIPYDLHDYDLPTLRGQAYLAAKEPAVAALEFRKVLDHPGLDPLSYEYPLAHFGLARALAQQNLIAESKSEYEKFFALWKDADADLPVLKQARMEYASLASRH